MPLFNFDFVLTVNMKLTSPLGSLGTTVGFSSLQGLMLALDSSSNILRHSRAASHREISESSTSQQAADFFFFFFNFCNCSIVPYDFEMVALI